MAKKTGNTNEIEFGQPKNCSEKCSQYKYCEAEGNPNRFLKGVTCPDFHLGDESAPSGPDENPPDEPKAGEKTGSQAVKDAKETATKTANTGTSPPKGSPPSDKPEGKTLTEAKKRYVFPRQGDIKCPGCGLYETIAVSTRGAIQVRQCTRAIPTCRYRHSTFKVKGTEVKSTDCKQGT